MGNILLGIDIGTGSCKCCLVEADGHILGQAIREYNPSRPHIGWAELDPTIWYASVSDCLRQIEAEEGISLKKVAGVCVTGQMRGPTFIDKSGNPVRPSILWNDLRCDVEVSELKNHYAGPLKQITHNPMNTMCTLPKVLWMQRHEPENWQKTATLLYPKDYINFRLTGERVTDHSDASGSCFYDMEQQTWSDVILKDWNLPKEKLPEIYPSTKVIGSINRQAQNDLGLPEGIPVAAGGSDTTVEMMAVGIENESKCKIRLGTSGGLSTVVTRLDGLAETGFYVWSYMLPGHWMIDTNTRACADSTAWLKDVFYKDMPTSRAAYERIGQEAGSISVGSEGLFFHPYLLGEDAPYWQPNLRGSFFGLSKAHGRPHCSRAVLEGTGFSLRDAQAVLGNLVKEFEEFVLIGGGTRNSVWTEIVTDILGVDCKVSPDTDSALGAAMLAGVASGVFAGLKQAVDSCSSYSQVIHHNPENHKAYSNLFEKYKQIKQVFDAAY